MQPMHDSMAKMHEQMERIASTQDPVERRRLIDEHYASMRSAMQGGMPGMHGGMIGMHGGMNGMHGGYGHGPGGHGAPPAAKP